MLLHVETCASRRGAARDATIRYVSRAIGGCPSHSAPVVRVMPMFWEGTRKRVQSEV